MTKKDRFARMLEGAEQAAAFAKGTADLKAYRIHISSELDARATPLGGSWCA